MHKCKQIITAIIAATLLMSITACNNKNDTKTNSSANTSSVTATTDTAASKTTSSTTSSKTTSSKTTSATSKKSVDTDSKSATSSKTTDSDKSASSPSYANTTTTSTQPSTQTTTTPRTTNNTTTSSRATSSRSSSSTTSSKKNTSSAASKVESNTDTTIDPKTEHEHKWVEHKTVRLNYTFVESFDTDIETDIEETTDVDTETDTDCECHYCKICYAAKHEDTDEKEIRNHVIIEDTDDDCMLPTDCTTDEYEAWVAKHNERHETTDMKDWYGDTIIARKRIHITDQWILSVKPGTKHIHIENDYAYVPEEYIDYEYCEYCGARK